jgi:hypothetical protein
VNSETLEEIGTSRPQQDISFQSQSIRTDIYEETVEYVGDPIRRINQDKVLRIGFININGLPQYLEDPKNKLIFNSIKDKQIGVLGLSEVNKCWHLLPDKDKWKDCTRGLWESSHSTFSYNRRDNKLSRNFQPGGTGLVSIGSSSHRVIDSGSDTKELGRWTWTGYRGKHNVTLRVISIYRPCKPSAPGPNTAFSQQQRYLNRISDSRCPRSAILEDIREYIDWWRNNDDQLVVGGDFNDDVCGETITQWSRQHQLTNAIGSQFNIQGKPTYHRGLTLIDGILISHTIKPLKVGYLPFGSFPSDH